MAYHPWIGNLKVNGRWGNYGTVTLLLDETTGGATQQLQVSVEIVWDDANVDWFFGDYSALGPKPGRATDYWGNPVAHWDPKGNAEDERDLFYTDLASDGDTEQLWQYFGHILPYWIEKSGGKLAGIRADFAQGLPNQRCTTAPATTRWATTTSGP